VIIEADYHARGIWWVLTKEELEAPVALFGDLTRTQRPGKPPIHLPPLSQGLRDDLQAWNQSWERSDGFRNDAEARRAWEEQGRELAARVQTELGTDGWEVLSRISGRVHRVHPPGSWPAGTWKQELLGYPSRKAQQ
jgi:hypothetical protein